MENKKNIIDGVDISGCEHYRAEIETKMPYGEYEILKDKCHYSGIEIIQDCKGNKGCIYKQLKRLQAEYDDLHLNYAGCKTANTGLQELNQKLQAENERLKKQYNCYACDSCGGKEDYINMKRHTENAIKTVHKYHQALQEIREMATLFHSVNENKGLDRFKNNILAKINEVIGAE